MLGNMLLLKNLNDAQLAYTVLIVETYILTGVSVNIISLAIRYSDFNKSFRGLLFKLTNMLPNIDLPRPSKQLKTLNM